MESEDSVDKKHWEFGVKIIDGRRAIPDFVITEFLGTRFSIQGSNKVSVRGRDLITHALVRKVLTSLAVNTNNYPPSKHQLWYLLRSDYL